MAEKKNVTNAQIYDMLWALGYREDILGTRGSMDLTGAQNSTFKDRLKRTGITDDDFDRAKQMARIDTTTVSGVAEFLRTMGLNDEAVDDMFKRAGVDIKNTRVDWNHKLDDVYRVAGETFGGDVGNALFFGPTNEPPKAAPPTSAASAPQPTPTPAPAPAAPAAAPTGPTATPSGTLGARTTTAAQQTPGIKALPTLPPNASEDEVVKYIRKWYGYSAWTLDVPELRQFMIGLTREFAGSDVDEARIEGALSATDWWKTHEGDQRKAIEERMSDPASYNAGVEGRFRTLASLAGQVGVQVSEGRLRNIARDAYDFNWDQAEMRAALANEFDYNPDTGAQDQSRIVGDLRQLASDYLVPLGEQTIDQWGRQIVAGTATNEDFTEYAKNMAKSMFGHYAADIDAGRTVKQIADPFVQMAARDLELTPDQINLEDAKWRRALEVDPDTGQPMQLSKWQRMIRTDSSYGWDYTQNARAEASDFARKIAESFGRA